jgi:hypothetical protein
MNDLEALKAEVFGRQKVLALIYKDFGNKSLYKYVDGWNISPPTERSKVVALEAGKLISKIYSEDIGKEAASQIGRLPFASTIDHHGILNHPFFINSNLIFSLFNKQKYLISFGTSSISLNNSSWPGCLLFNNDRGELGRISFFPDKIKNKTVYAAPAIKPEDVWKVLNNINKSPYCNSEQKDKLGALVQEVFNNSRVFELPNFSTQASLISYKLWSEIFPSAKKIVYLPIEDLVSQILADKICTDSDNLLYNLFFSQKGLVLLEKYFSGSLGAFSSQHKGSFLFWALDGKGRRVHLQKKGNGIYGGRISIKLEPEVIAKALVKRQIYPTTLVCFLVLLYYQFTCIGGFNQVNWLTDIKDKFVLLLNEFGFDDEVKKITLMSTDNFAEADLAFLSKAGELEKASGIDLYLSGKDLYSTYFKLAEQLTLAQCIENSLPEIYKVVVSANMRKPSLLELTSKFIAHNNGTEKTAAESLRY